MLDFLKRIPELLHFKPKASTGGASRKAAVSVKAKTESAPQRGRGTGRGQTPPKRSGGGPKSRKK